MFQVAWWIDELKKLMKELGEAINQSVADSDEISDVMSRIKAGGYDVFLVLEATIGFNQREGRRRHLRRKSNTTPPASWRSPRRT